jgi:ABC-type nitrate/sulfonate/bicarbonate transport system substrate-binding protein
MKTTDLGDLLNTVEAMRVERHPDLDAGFLAAVVAAEEANLDDDDAAIRAIEKALQELLVREENAS